MAIRILAIALVLLTLVGCGRTEDQQLTPASITLVESTPEGTVLDSPDIPQTAGIWLDMINGAERTLDIAEFYIADSMGQALEPIVDAVIDAGRRGVKVRILVEKSFADIYPEPLVRLRSAPGSDVRLYDIGDQTGGGVMHAKYFIVDGRTVFVGSQNWDWRALTQINELGVRLTTLPVAAAFTHVFDFDWALAGGMTIAQAAQATGTLTESYPVIISDSLGEHEVTPVFSPHDLLPQGTEWDELALQDLMRTAKDSIKLQVLSYRTHAPLEKELLDAAARGVQVHILVSDWSLKPEQQEDLKNLEQKNNITVKISSIPELASGFIPYARVEHCKYLLVDTDRAWIGTNNWSREYFLSSRNAGIILRSPSLVAILHEKYSRSWDGPYVSEMDPDRTYTPRERDHGSGR